MHSKSDDGWLRIFKTGLRPQRTLSSLQRRRNSSGPFDFFPSVSRSGQAMAPLRLRQRCNRESAHHARNGGPRRRRNRLPNYRDCSRLTASRKSETSSAVRGRGDIRSSRGRSLPLVLDGDITAFQALTCWAIHAPRFRSPFIHSVNLGTWHASSSPDRLMGLA